MLIIRPSFANRGRFGQKLQNIDLAKKLFILLILCFGMALAPHTAYACHMQADNLAQPGMHGKKICKKGNKSCCANKCSNKDVQHDGSRKGNCQHNCCHCPFFNFGFALLQKDILKVNAVALKKHRPYFPQLLLMTGFYSIWRPPKVN